MSDKPKLTCDTGPFKDVIFLGHSSVEDYDREAGALGTCLTDADKNLLYRDTLPTVHGKAEGMIKELSGLTPSVNAKLTEKAQDRENAAAAKANREPKKVKDVEETFISFVGRVKDSVSEDIWKQIDAKFRELALATPIDASPAARQGGVSAANLAKAKEVLSRDPAAIETAVEKMLAKVPSFELVRDTANVPDEESLARLIGGFSAVLLAEAKNSI